MRFRAATDADKVPDGQNNFDVARNDNRRGYELSRQRLDAKTEPPEGEQEEMVSLSVQVSGSAEPSGVSDVKETPDEPGQPREI